MLLLTHFCDTDRHVNATRPERVTAFGNSKRWRVFTADAACRRSVGLRRKFRAAGVLFVGTPAPVARARIRAGILVFHGYGELDLGRDGIAREAELLQERLGRSRLAEGVGHAGPLDRNRVILRQILGDGAA